MRSSSEDRIPVNISLFSPKILGMNARQAVLLILVVSSASLISRFSLLYSAAIVIGGIFLLFPMKGDLTLFGVLAESISWKAATMRVIPRQSAEIGNYNGIPVLEEGSRKGVCLEISADPLHALSRSDRTSFLNGVFSALASVDHDLTFLSTPSNIAAEDFHLEKEDEFSEDYNLLLDFILSDQYYYRSFIVIWNKPKGAGDRKVENLVESAGSLASALTGSSARCWVVSSTDVAEKVLEGLV